MDISVLLFDFLSAGTPFAIVLLATGAVAGVLAGLLGVGGGIVIVPVLFNVLPFLGVEHDVLMHVAVGTSLATIIPTSIISSRSHYRRGGLDIDLLKTLGPAVFVGVVVGTVLGGRARGDILTAVFAVVAVLVAANMWFQRAAVVLAESLPKTPFRQGLGLIIGGFSVVMGIGGGTLSVPILTAFNVPIRRAVGTASALGLVIAVPGTVGFILSGVGDPHLPPGNVGYANLIGFCLIVPMTMLTAPLGSRIAHTINPALLRRAFAVFLLLTALRMGYSLLDLVHP